MPGITSFYHAIFKRFQAAYHAGGSTSFDGHLSKDDTSGGLYGGFSLKWPGDPYGLFGSLSAAAPNVPQTGFTLSAGLKPLVSGSTVPADNPLYAMLAASLGPAGTVPDFVTVAGQKWPVMPPPEQGTQFNQAWLDYNTGSPPALVDAFGTWIAAGQVDDSPKGSLIYPALMAVPPAAFPGADTYILFVASFPGDDGRRNGDGAMPVVPLNHVPPNYWDTAPIYLTDEQGNLFNGTTLAPHVEYYVASVIGHCGTGIAGGLFTSPPQPVQVQCDAFCFNTALSPNYPLPSLGNIVGTDINPIYEQLYMDPLTYEVAGFRFNVDAVFAGLEAALVAANMNLGGATAAQWLLGGHPCVKVRIVNGEYPNKFQPQGAVPGFGSDPQKDRHITQKNLVPFDPMVMAHKPVNWTNFIVSQAGEGANVLTLQHGLPPNDVRFYVAMPTAIYDRYVRDGGSARGFEIVREGVPKPFPDAVILRQVSAEAQLVVAPHGAGRDGRVGADPFLGMSLGLAGPTAARLGDVRVIHSAHDVANGTHVAGGFTLRPVRRG
jgi:hypothetical protein